MIQRNKLIKNACGARIGEIWRLGPFGWRYLLLELLEAHMGLGSTEDTFDAICLDTGERTRVFFSHGHMMGWTRVA